MRGGSHTVYLEDAFLTGVMVEQSNKTEEQFNNKNKGPKSVEKQREKLQKKFGVTTSNFSFPKLVSHS